MFKMIFNIAKTELAVLFYSPVAWLILVAFGIQAGINFSATVQKLCMYSEMGYHIGSATFDMFADPWSGLLVEMGDYLYFYIPLLTMSLISKELSSGSIKLLYAAPLSNLEIILGKFLSMMIYGLCMTGLLFLVALCGSLVIQDFDWPLVFSGLLGIYLLICAYAAIGIFMSSLTSYQIVAAIGTLAVLIVLSMVGGWGQEYAFVRDITYWLSITGRSRQFINGLICSEDVLYFIILLSFFLALAIIRLDAVRQRIRFSSTFIKNLGVVCLVCLLGYITSLPHMKFYYDATATKMNTLTPNSQDIISRLDGDVTITTYINALEASAGWYACAEFVKPDMERFEPYLRFKPDMKMKYVYYYDTVANPRLDKKYPNHTLKEKLKEVCKTNHWNTNRFLSPEEIRKKIDLSGEGNTFVRQIVRENGEKAWLRIYNDLQRYPSEKEISASLKRMVMKLPKVGFVDGHGERSFYGGKDSDYSAFANDKAFRYALENQGFDVASVHLDRPVPEDINIMVISDMKEWFNNEEERHLDEYINRGSNLIILGEPRRRDIMQPLFARFGFETTTGQLVKQDTNLMPDIIMSFPTPEAGNIAYDFSKMARKHEVVSTPTCSGLIQKKDLGFKVTEILQTDTCGTVWNELQTKDFIDDSIRYNPESGERQDIYTTAVALEREIGSRHQKIILTGDADCISSGEFGRRARYRLNNFGLITGSFFWLSDNEVPIDVRRPAPTDHVILIKDEGSRIIKWTYTLIIPLLLALAGILVWLRRSGR